MVVAHGRTVVDWPPQVDVETPEVLDLEIGKGMERAVVGAVAKAVGPRETKWLALHTDSVVPSVEVFSS
jgi:hypothetical protein